MTHDRTVFHRHEGDEGYTGGAQGVHERGLVGPPEGRLVDLADGPAVHRCFGADLEQVRSSAKRVLRRAYNPFALCDTVAAMQEVRVTSLDGFEATEGGVRILANSGELALVFPREVWEALAEVSPPPEPDAGELEELEELRRALEEHAAENGFATVLADVPCGGESSGQKLDLVLRPSGMLAVTTGYAFLPVVRAEHVARFGVSLDEDAFVEQAYLVGAVAEEAALAGTLGDESLKTLSVRGRRCSSSRFELAPELWRVLSEKLGWRDVKLASPSTKKGNV